MLDDFGLVEAVDRLCESIDAPMFVKRQEPGPVRRRGRGIFRGQCSA
jgi:hypothetical protein